MSQGFVEFEISAKWNNSNITKSLSWPEGSNSGDESLALNLPISAKCFDISVPSILPMNIALALL